MELLAVSDFVKLNNALNKQLLINRILFTVLVLKPFRRHNLIQSENFKM